MSGKAHQIDDSETDTLQFAFRTAMRDMAGTVAIISTEVEGERHGMAATSVISLSMDPPSVLFCVNRDASIHGPLMRRSAAAINILGNDQASLCKVFSGGEKGAARFRHGTWHTGPEGLPCLAEAVETLVVRCQEQFAHGTHTVFSGDILNVLPGTARSPLVYLNGTFLTPD